MNNLAEREKLYDDLLEYKLNEALNNEQVFETLDHDYEIVQAYKGQIMRALRNLDGAIKGDQISRDAVFTALSQMQDNLERILKIQAESELGD